jgi:hypothetical protein
MIALLSYAGWQFQKKHVYQIHPQVLQKNNIDVLLVELLLELIVCLDN